MVTLHPTYHSSFCTQRFCRPLKSRLPSVNIFSWKPRHAGNSIAAQPTAAARTQAITQSQSSGLASNANGTACGGQGRGPGQAEPNCDCCGRSHPDEAHGAMTSRGSTDAHGSAQSLSGTRSIVPAPPAGPVGFSSPAVPSMLQPLTPKVLIHGLRRTR